jgi:UDP-glucose 4-epimerase
MKKRIFVTGAAGFLGSHLAEAMIKAGHDVIGCDNLVGGYQDNVPAGCEFHQADCTDIKAMRELTKGVDVVYHAAAYPYEGLSVFSPSIVNLSIYQATSTVLSAFVQNRGRRFVFLSSMARYGTNVTPFTEDMAPRPQDPYALSKVASEDMVRLMARIFNFEYVIAVPHNIIGSRQKYDDPFRNVASIFINRMLQGKQPIIYGDGNQKRCFSFVQDCIDPLMKMLDHPEVVGEVINIGPDEEFVTINELAGTVADILHFKLEPIYFPERPQEVKEANCASDKARRLLGYKTGTTLRRGLEEMAEWIKTRGAKPFDYYLEVEIINELTPRSWKERLM